jgi:hypothetical protein
MFIQDLGPASTFRGWDPKAAVIRIDDGAANGQAHTHSVLFNREESLEGILWVFHADSMIPYLPAERIFGRHSQSC